MAEYLGLDWASKGWFGVVLRDDDSPQSDLYPSIQSVWKNHKDAERILIDIPIGLKDAGKRACDVEAKEYLKPHRQNSVFPTPVRKAVDAKTLEGAKEINEQYGFSITNQAWSIALRIREVDEFLDQNPEAIGVLRESHPEVCFAALNEDEPMEHGKNSDEGLESRQRVLFEEDESLEAVYDNAVETFIDHPAWARRMSKNAKDDVLDALVLAHTARMDDGNLRTLPEEPEHDSTKEKPLPIEIVYPSA
jgi:predicted RNase H-like nuclease